MNFEIGEASGSELSLREFLDRGLSGRVSDARHHVDTVVGELPRKRRRIAADARCRELIAGAFDVRFLIDCRRSRTNASDENENRKQSRHIDLPASRYTRRDSSSIQSRT